MTQYYKLLRIYKDGSSAPVTDEKGFHFLTVEPRCQASEDVMAQLKGMLGNSGDLAEWRAIEEMESV